jgi:predicted nucleic acid-binding protein
VDLRETIAYVCTMRPQRVYLDTSVIGGCFDAEFASWSNALMKDFRIGIYHPVVSELVAVEVENAPEPVHDAYAELLVMGAEVLAVDPGVTELARTYQERGILTPKYYDDGVHIALATAAEVDLLVSWNFRHIVHYQKIRLFNAVHLEMGYKPLQIYSPREVAQHGTDAD